MHPVLRLRRNVRWECPHHSRREHATSDCPSSRYPQNNFHFFSGNAVVRVYQHAECTASEITLRSPRWKTGNSSVVDDFIGNVAADDRINRFFAKTNIPRLNTMLVNQICEATGGPCKYEGRSMKAAHTGMGLSDADFNALVEDLVKSLNKFNVPEKEKKELITALAAMKGDIVGK